MLAMMRDRLSPTRTRRGKTGWTRGLRKTPRNVLKKLDQFSAIVQLEQLEALSWIMPPLNGQMLEVPRLYAVAWKEGQVFQNKEDPDRILTPWSAPDFEWFGDPVQQSARTSCIDLPIHNAVPGRRFAKVISKVLSEKACAALLEAANAKGFTPTLLNVGSDQKVLQQEPGGGQQGQQVTVNSLDLAAWLMEVLRPHLPAELDGCGLLDLNERFQFLCYLPGQSSPEHMDLCSQRDGGHGHCGAHSRVSVQIYLHDVPRSHGGSMTFFPGTKKELTVQPRAGSAVIFTQDILHEGSLLFAGIKYTLRTEAMYQVMGSTTFATQL